ncbi:MAG TPA: polysaccharide deacetylase family protein [Solirubrobacteraceae bacterium]|nr:polysaccharide deacetylase family protein [Solirubrobacteraceae bacterium]
MDIDQRRARREARRRDYARRRARGLAAVAVIAAAVLTAAGLLSCGSSSRSTSTSGTAPATGGAQAGSGARHSAAPGPAADTKRGTRVSTMRTPSGARGGEPVPILMYHVINPPPPGAKFPGLYVPAEEFAAQMRTLAQAGFRAVTMDEMLANWTHGTPLPAGKPVVVSFDNGYQSQLTQALPVLRRLGWVGVENIQLTGLPPSQGGLSQAQVSELVANGWELDTQGISHADLITLGPAALRYQVAVARAEVQRRYHVPANWFCYPSGHYSAAVIAEVKAAGYVGSTTVIPGWATPGEDLYRLPRLRVLGGTSPQALLGQIAAVRSNPAPPASYGPSG